MNKKIEVRELVKKFGKKEILKGIDMEIPQGEFLTLLGPSGAGKTTFLKILAGVIDADGGRIIFPPEMKQSPVMVFQDYQLFPYMSVYNNIAFGLQAKKKPRKEIEHKVQKIASTLGIQNHLRSYPAQLSGGEKQRCALARALILNPAILLLDEPFANLDKNLKSDTAHLLKRIQREFDLTIVSVSHDQEEAMMLSNTIALLSGGKLLEYGRAEQLYGAPRTLTGARFFGQVNAIGREWFKYFYLEEKEMVYCRPENLIIRKCAKGLATVEQRFFKGGSYKYLVKLGKLALEVHSMKEKLHPGDAVDLRINGYFTLPKQVGENQSPQIVKGGLNGL